MTFEQFLETWNSDLSAKIIEFTGELGYTDHPEILAQTLEYGIAYADFFENADGHNTDLLIFLKAICVRVIFFSEDTEIENRSGRLWERAIASMSMPHQRLVQIPLEADAVEEILRPLKSLQLEKEQDTLHQELFNPIRSRLEGQQATAARKHATTALRYAMARVLIQEEVHEK